MDLPAIVRSQRRGRRRRGRRMRGRRRRGRRRRGRRRRGRRRRGRRRRQGIKREYEIIESKKMGKLDVERCENFIAEINIRVNKSQKHVQ